MKPHLDTKCDACQSCRKLAGGGSINTNEPRKKASQGRYIIPVVLQSSTSSPSSSSVVQVGTLPNPWINGEALLPIVLCLIW